MFRLAVLLPLLIEGAAAFSTLTGIPRSAAALNSPLPSPKAEYIGRLALVAQGNNRRARLPLACGALV